MDWYGKEKGVSIATAVHAPADVDASPVPA
jgi:hypothetical protein